MTFPVDEISRISAFIPIVDDEINEAWKQVFVVLLQVEEAVNSDLITITRADSTCVIIDNDGKQLDSIMKCDLILMFSCCVHVQMFKLGLLDPCTPLLNQILKL